MHRRCLHDPRVIVMKFGGTSVGNERSIRQVVQIVRQHLDRRPVVVVSAHAGVTDALLELARKAPGGDADTRAIEERHRAILRELGTTEEKLQAMEPKQRAAMEDMIAERLKQKVEQEAEKKTGLLVDISA